jgi:site-specific DNA-methyltransferase (adenine-specific)
VSFPKVLLQKGVKLDWTTPYPLWQELNNEFRFELDAAACKHNLLNTPYFYTEEDNGLKRIWRSPTFVNPPYGRDSISRWLEKAWREWSGNITSVFLLPARTGTKWFHTFIWDTERHRPYNKVEVRFLRSRLLFGVCKHCHPDYEKPANTHTNTAPFDSMIVVFHGTNTSHN